MLIDTKNFVRLDSVDSGRRNHQGFNWGRIKYDIEERRLWAMSLLKVREHVSCPNCWATVTPYETLWVSTHPDLRGDQFLGDDAQKRFLPSRFDVNGFALDSQGQRCEQLACPKCHLTLPRILFELKPMFVSIIGAPSSGKSYFLASSIWQARQKFRQLEVAFSDADPVANQILSGYEQKLFLNDNPENLVAIPKTEEEGELYQSVNFGTHTEMFARPFVFSMQPTAKHPWMNGDDRGTLQSSRALCLYDNAGEHFQARAEAGLSPATNHLALSEALLFVFDPLQHPKFRAECRKFSTDPQLDQSRGATHRQDEILQEAAKRIKQKNNLASHQRVNKPLIVVVNKCDVWQPLAPDLKLDEISIYEKTKGGVVGLNLSTIEETSATVRQLLERLTPEFISACETFSDDVTYLPASPQGCSPEESQSGGGVSMGVRPSRIKPIWAEVPLLFAIAKGKCPLLPMVRRKSK